MSHSLATNPILQSWNRFDTRTAAEAILPCNGSPAWAAGVVARSPFEIPGELFAASDDVWRSLPQSDWQQAFDSHPRIGEKHARAATSASLSWSAGEQSAATGGENTAAALAAGNRAYEARFGRVFLVCATGKSASQILDALQRRLNNDSKTELLEAAEQQREITQLRLRKWLALELPASTNTAQ